MSEENNEIICEYCNVKCKSKKILYEHQKNSIKCLKIRGKEIIKFKCNNCSKEYNGNEAYRRHINKCNEIEIKYGYIYKIEPTVIHDKYEIYFGSTIENIDIRFSKHKSMYKKYTINNVEYNKYYCSCYKLFDKYGIDNCNIEIVEELENTTKNRLLKQENYYINTYYNINEQNSFRSLEEDKEYYENYRKNNKEKIKERDHKYYENNKEKILQQQKEKRENMTEEEREKYLQHRKETRNNEQEKKTKSQIEKCKYCGKEVRHDHITGHYNSNECRKARGEELITYKCDKCDKTFNSKSMYLKHTYGKICEEKPIINEKKCIIYKIFDIYFEYDFDIYYTHKTIQEVKTKDKYEYNKYLEGNKSEKKKRDKKNDLIENAGGLENVEYYILEEYNHKLYEDKGEEKIECNKRIDYWYEKYKGKTKVEETYQKTKEKQRERYKEDEEYRERKKKDAKRYQNDNREIKKNYLKEYYENNKEELNEKNRNYWDIHKDEINKKRREEYVECEYCKEQINKCHLKNHQNSDKCKKYQNINNNENKIKCEYCEKIVGIRDLPRHKKSEFCQAYQNNGSDFKEIECEYCHERVKENIIKKHQESERCKGIKNGTFDLTNYIQCEICNKYILKTKIKEHQNRKSCKKYIIKKDEEDM